MSKLAPTLVVVVGFRFLDVRFRFRDLYVHVLSDASSLMRISSESCCFG